MCLSVMMIFWLWLLVIYVSVCLWKRKGVSSITDWTFLPLYESTEEFEQSVCVHDYDLLLLCVVWYGGNVSLCGMENYPYPRHRKWWTFKVTIEEKHTNFQVNKDWYIFHSHKPTCTSTCWCWCCSTNTLLKKHPGKLKDDLTTKVWNLNLNSKCLKIVKIWSLHPVLLYFCFLTKRTEKSISSAINSSTFSHDFWIRSLLPFEHSGTVGVHSLRPWTLPILPT